MAEQHRTPDARQLGEESLPRGSFPAARSDFRVYFDAATHERICQHAGEDKSVEICGILVGSWEQDANGPFVVVSESIRCDEAAKKSGEVTFTHDAWTTINREMDMRFVDLKIVGWYHSHPDFGIFLSERDQFIHEHFFSNPGQVALVVDPVQKSEGVFVWRNGKPKPCSHYWVGERICTTAAEDPTAAERPSPAGPARVTETPPAAGPSFWTMVWWAIPLACMFLIGYLLADMKSNWERQRIIEGTVAHFGNWKCLRPGLRENLDKVADNVKMIQAAVGQLADQHAKLAGDDAAEVKAHWGEVLKAISGTRENLYVLSQVYGLDSAEETALKARFPDKITELSVPAREKPAAKENSSPREKSVPEEKKEKSAPTPPKGSDKPQPQTRTSRPWTTCGAGVSPVLAAGTAAPQDLEVVPR
jgi:proteasome lid subunit RPN8/RPN11